MTVSRYDSHSTKSSATGRNISLFTISSRHPLNVKPEGNSYLSTGDDYDTTKFLPRHVQMGVFNRFPDELIMYMISFIDDIESLKNLSHTSRIMYAYMYDEEIWKKLYVKKIKDGPESNRDSVFEDWKGSWRSTLLNIKDTDQSNLQLPGNILCSDVLYRPYQCSQVDYEKLFHKIVKEEETYHSRVNETDFDLQSELKILPNGRILRISESLLSMNDFNENFHDKPFILTNSDKDRWPHWTLEGLVERFPDVVFRQEAVQWPLSLYSKYLARNKDESPLYLFDCSSVAMKTLREEYIVPKIFQYDLFTVFENQEINCRPDHAWLIIGPKRSGSTFHKDPNYTSAWNTAIYGRKLWIMLPPDIVPPGVGTDDEESEVTSPVGIAEWVMSGFFNDAVKLESCLVGITFPGECMHVPSGWWHAVINLDDSIALTQNFVPLPKLSNTLNFFKNKKNQISGFRPNQFKMTLDHLLGTLPAEDDDVRTLKHYKQQYESLDLENDLQLEDCGEIVSSKLPPMPIFELFKQLLILNGKKQELNAALSRLAKLEKPDVKQGNKSKIWQNLVENKTNSEESKEVAPRGFSFGFALDESSDEDI